jgi:2'-hydroxyisoflavone reductase
LRIGASDKATRRQFTGGSLLLACASVVGARSVAEPAAKELEMLVLGRTGFIGPHEIDYALERGHSETLFNRGRNAGLYGGRVEPLRDPAGVMPEAYSRRTASYFELKHGRYS